MDDGKRRRVMRNVLTENLTKHRSEFENLIEISDFVNAETKAEMMYAVISRLEEINDMICRSVEDEAELKEEMSRESEILEIRCQIAAKLKSIEVMTHPP